jgi:type II secretory pathway pseudopilin PulG
MNNSHNSTIKTFLSVSTTRTSPEKGDRTIPTSEAIEQLQHPQRGTTLVEILITISIIVLMLGVGIPAFRTYKYQNELTQNAEYIKDQVQATQNYALAPEYDKSSDIDSYIFNISTNENSTYTYRGICTRDGLTKILDESDIIKKNVLPENITMSLIGNSDICFSIKDQGKAIYPTANTIEITLTHNKISDPAKNFRKITIYLATGQVTISK